MNNNELRHHGILGQKWGVRRFQNKDGTLKVAGRRRYDVDLESGKKRVRLAREQEKEALSNLRGSGSRWREIYDEEDKMTYFVNDSQERFKEYLNAKNNVARQKSKLADEKAKAGLNEETRNKSNHRINLEQHYLKKGLSAEEAEIAAYKRSRTEKILATAGGTTVAMATLAAATSAAHKHILKKSTMGISSIKNESVQKGFAYINKMLARR